MLAFVLPAVSGLPSNSTLRFFGRAVHVAARLEQHAGLDEILVSKEFAQLLDAEFVLAARPPADISGLRRPLNHCALLD